GLVAGIRINVAVDFRVALEVLWLRPADRSLDLRLAHARLVRHVRHELVIVRGKLGDRSGVHAGGIGARPATTQILVEVDRALEGSAEVWILERRRMPLGMLADHVDVVVRRIELPRRRGSRERGTAGNRHAVDRDIPGVTDGQRSTALEEGDRKSGV